MTMAEFHKGKYFPGGGEDDLKELDGLAVQGLPFEEAFKLFEGKMSEADARPAFEYLQRFYGKPVG